MPLHAQRTSQVMLKPMWWWLPPSKSLSFSLSLIYHFSPFSFTDFSLFAVFTPLFLSSCLSVAQSVTPPFISQSFLARLFCLNTQQMLPKRGSQPSHLASALTPFPLIVPSPPSIQHCIYFLPSTLFNFFCCLPFLSYKLPLLFLSFFIHLIITVQFPIFFYITPCFCLLPAFSCTAI